FRSTWFPRNSILIVLAVYVRVSVGPVMIILADGLVQVVGIDRNLHHIHLVAIEVEYEQAHAVAFRPCEDQRLFAPLLAGFANHPLPALAQLLFDDAIQFVAVDIFREVLELRDMHATYAAMCCPARYKARKAQKGNTRGMRVIAALDRVHDDIEAAAGSGEDQDGRDREDHHTKRNPENGPHCVPPFLLVLASALVFSFVLLSRSPSTPRPPRLRRAPS